MTHVHNAQDSARYLLSLNGRPSSAAVIVEDSQEKAIVVKANYKDYWTFPGGMIDAHETPKVAALREVAEEIGLIIKPENIVFRWVAARHSEIVDTYQFIFASALEPGMIDHIVLQTSEIDEWRLVSKDEVLSNNRHYAKAVLLWANNNSEGYIEQSFTVNFHESSQ